MDDCISKPVQIETLRAVLNSWSAIISPEDSISGETPPKLKIQSSDLVDKNMEVLVDRESLNLLSGGDSAVELELLGAFIQDAPSHLLGAKVALEAVDFDMLVYEAHQLKGSASMVGIRQLPELAARLEDKAKEKYFDEAAKLIPQLEMIYKQIKAWIPSLNKPNK